MRVRLFKTSDGKFDVLVQHPRQHNLPRLLRKSLAKGELLPVVRQEALKEESVRAQIRAIQPEVAEG